MDRYFCLIFAIKWWPDHFCWRKYDYFREFWDDILLMTNLKKIISFSFFHFFYVSKSKNSWESYEAAGWSWSIWKQVHYYLFIFLSLFSTALPLLCVMSSFSYFLDFFNYLLSLWMYIFDRCIISFSLFFIPPIFFRFYFILFYNYIFILLYIEFRILLFNILIFSDK